MSVQNTPTAAGATQVNALVGIKSRPGWLIVVAGHTDDVGDERANQQLSLTGPSLVSGSEWNTACEQNGVTFSLTVDNQSLDPVLGYAGIASVWLAITIAQAAFDVRGDQVIAAQPVANKDEIWVVVLSRQHGLKETPGNV